MTRDWYVGALSGLSTLVIGTPIVSALYQRWPQLNDVLLGDTGVIPLLIGTGTVVFLGVNARTALHTLQNTQSTLEHSRQSQLIETFQRASEMLGDEMPSVQAGGVALLAEVARADVPRLSRAVGIIFQTFILDNERESYAVLAEALKKGDQDAPVVRTKSSTTTALGTFGKLMSEGRIAVAPEDRVLNSVYLYQWDRCVVFLPGTLLRTPLFHRVSFFGGSFAGAVISKGLVGSGVIFDRVDFSGAVLELSRPDGTEFGPNDHVVLFDQCKMDGATINGMPLKDWVAASTALRVRVGVDQVPQMEASGPLQK